MAELAWLAWLAWLAGLVCQLVGLVVNHLECQHLASYYRKGLLAIEMHVEVASHSQEVHHYHREWDPQLVDLAVLEDFWVQSSPLGI